MTPTLVATVPDHLDQAGQALRQVLVRLHQYAKGRVHRLDPSARYADSAMNHVRDLDALMVAVQQYEQAVLACLPAEQAPVAEQDLTQLTPEEVLAVRQADPVYQLGYLRGLQAGIAQEQRKHAPALQLYAQHAQFPPPPPTPASDYDGLVCRVKKVLATMTQRYGAGPISSHLLPTTRHGNV